MRGVENEDRLSRSSGPVRAKHTDLAIASSVENLRAKRGKTFKWRVVYHRWTNTVNKFPMADLVVYRF